MDAPTNIAGYNPHRDSDGCYWDETAAQLAVDFFPDVLTHPDDSPTCKAGDPFLLQPWQRDYVATLFGWKRKADGSRRYTESLGAVPRKNGKTALAAGIALYCLWAERKQGAQIYSAAMDRDQASAIYRTAARMVRQHPSLAKSLHAIDSTKRIVFRRTGSFYEALSGDADTGHSRKPYAILFDELHTQKSRDLYDNLRTGQGATNNPLFLSITTAGHDRHSICFEVWNRARQIRDGERRDAHFLPMLYELRENEDWNNEKVWERCNPNLGVSIDWKFLREEYATAKESPAYENTFRNRYLNEWTEQATRWLSMDKWRSCGGPLSNGLEGRDCWAGLDLSSTEDISALCLAFPNEHGGHDLIMRFWIPVEEARKRSRLDRVPYVEWIKSGHLKASDTHSGLSIDYDLIRAEINELAKVYNIREIAIDPWNATQLALDLESKDGFNVEKFRQGYASMSAPTKDFDRQVRGGMLRHGDHPILTWMAGNVAVEKDAAGNLKPTKEKSTERIDGIVAAVMAVGRASAAEVSECWNPADGVTL